MSTTESSISSQLFIIKRETDNQSCKELIKDLKCNCSPTVTFLSQPMNGYVEITLDVSYAYSHKHASYTFNTKVIKSDRVMLNDLMESLSNSMPLDSYTISYSDNSNGVYFSCGKYPFDTPIYCALTSSRILHIKLRQFFLIDLKTKLDLLENEEIDHVRLGQAKKTNYFINEKSKRARERTIAEIIQKVFLWKKIYSGITDKNGNLVKFTLKEAAELTEISQKTLDEYDHQLKFGRLLGFDFNKYKQAKVGVLRGFVRNQVKGLAPSENEQLKLGKSLRSIRKIEEVSTEPLDDAHYCMDNNNSNNNSNCNSNSNEIDNDLFCSTMNQDNHYLFDSYSFCGDDNMIESIGFGLDI